ESRTFLVVKNCLALIPTGEPFLKDVERRTDIFLRVHRLAFPRAMEIVRDLVVIDSRRIKHAVKRKRSQCEFELLLFEMIRTKPFEDYGRYTTRRSQVRQQSNQLRQILVLFGTLARKPVQNVPVRIDAVFVTPLEHPNVLNRRDALAHYAQQLSIKTLNARLNLRDARGCEFANLLARQVSLHFVEERKVKICFSQTWQQLLEVAHVQNIIDRIQRQAAILSRQFQDLFINSAGLFFTKSHVVSVQAAERAVSLCAPPATARRFKRKRDAKALIDIGARDFLHEIRIIRHRRLVEIAQ